MKKIIISNEIIVSHKDKIIDVIKKMTEGNYRFQIVVENGKLLGTISDGDIRRGILQGNSYNVKITKCMNKNPLIGHTYKSYKHRILLNTVGSIVKFLPVLDRSNNVKYVLIEEINVTSKTALIMAGGFGKRLGDKTKNTPKPLLKVGKEPILELILQKLEYYNYQKIFISTHYLSQKIEKFIKKRKSKAEVFIIREEDPMGTAGSIKLLPDNVSSPLTIINGDVLSDLNLNSLISFHFEKNNSITLCAAQYEINIPFGLISFNKKHQLTNLKEKPTLKNYILSGIYCIEKEMFSLINKSNFDMTELILKANKLGKKVGIFPIYENWRDIGSLKELNLANKNTRKNI
ncbi:MAG: hypothetical protein CBC22_03965 [Alphaproteobacteria bacterium TMED62]|nr:MAG: hypothetical protein CBC22_03965 [Alphaproteobacteria bacterium TMED62]